MARAAFWTALAAAWMAAGCWEAEAGGSRVGEGAPASPSGLRHERLIAGGLDRSYSVYRPGRLRRPPPVVLAFHGGSGGTGARLRGFVGPVLEELAEERGFLVVYPDGVGGAWNDCRAGAAYAANLGNVDDPGFVRRVLGRLRRDDGADVTRVYALGYSNGGHLAYRLALETPDRVRAVAAFGANLPEADALDCAPSGRAVPVLVVNGTADGINPFDGGEVRAPDGTPLGAVRSARATAEYFAGLGGPRPLVCEEAVVLRDPADGPGVTRTTWTSPGAPPVELVTVHGGGHAVPGPGVFPEFVGPVERRYDGVRDAVDFFLGGGRGCPRA